MVIGEDESKFIFFGCGDPHGFQRNPPYTSIHAQAYCLVFSFQPMNTVASYYGSPLSFFPRETLRKRRQCELCIKVMRNGLLACGPLHEGKVGRQRGD
jgi:hypothetical protein